MARHWDIKGKRALVRYADDFVIFTETKEDALAAKQVMSDWLQERGLTLSKEKTKVCHLTEGFDFLGFNIRHYPVSNTRTGFKLLIKPSKKSVANFLHRLKHEWKDLTGSNAETAIKRLRPITRGWANYFRHGVSKELFVKVDNYMFQRIIRWSKRTHPAKSWTWIKKTYFQTIRGDRWVFGTEKNHLPKVSSVPITRHIGVKYDASPDDGLLKEYWEWRDRKKLALLHTQRLRELARRQNGKCSVCRNSLNNDEELHIHHVIPRSQGGKDQPSNLALVHLYCHQQVHGRNHINSFSSSSKRFISK